MYALRARKGDQGHRIGLARDLHFLGNKVFAPASGVALIFGIWMVIERPTFAFGDTWIIIGLIGLAISGTIGGVLRTQDQGAGGPAGGRRRRRLPDGHDHAGGAL